MGEDASDSDYPFFFTWAAQRGVSGLEITGGEGVYFFTGDGGRWLDFGSLRYNANLGHGEARITSAIARQAEKLCLVMPEAVFPEKRELAERLLALAPEGYSKVFFTTGGAEATENAIKMARMATGRYKLISRYRSYHGATMGAISLTGDWRRPPVEPGLPGVIHAQDCYCDRCPFGHTLGSCQIECATHIGDIIEMEDPSSVAAVVLESVPGANGVLIPAPEYWPRVRELCDRHGVLLIADEVLAGFGRTGKCFGFEHWGAVPDMITVAKALTGGYGTLGAVLVHERVAKCFEKKLLVAGLTGYAHPLACAAGNAALSIYEGDGLYQAAASLEPHLLGGLVQLQRAYPERLPFVRGIGLLAIAELDLAPDEWSRLVAALLRRRLYIHLNKRRRTLTFAPPLIIAEQEIAAGMALVAEAFAEAFGPPPGGGWPSK